MAVPPADHEAIFEFEYADRDAARLVSESIAREVEDLADDRSWTTLERTDETVQLTILARDLTALRAALNTWLTLVSVAERVGGVDATPV